MFYFLPEVAAPRCSPDHPRLPRRQRSCVDLDTCGPSQWTDSRLSLEPSTGTSHISGTHRWTIENKIIYGFFWPKKVTVCIAQNTVHSCPISTHSGNIEPRYNCCMKIINLQWNFTNRISLGTRLGYTGSVRLSHIQIRFKSRISNKTAFSVKLRSQPTVY